MGHDISGFNKMGEEIAYARFSMWNHYSSILYDVLDAQEYNSGISGTGEEAVFTKEQMETALKIFKKLVKEKTFSADELWEYSYKEILVFIENCLQTATAEGEVRIGFF